MKRSVEEWLWVVAALLIYTAIAVVFVVMLAQSRPANAAVGCRPPDPEARPVISLAAGELRTLARLAWGEGRSEGYCGMVAISAVVINRMKRNPKTFGATVTQVINKPYAFSSFGKTDPNRLKMAKIDESDEHYLRATLAALAAVVGQDPTGGAVYFIAVGSRPGWASRMLVTARIGQHIFMRPD
jgi:N-acetylmuramoyl-L-alanine amidase